MYPPFPHAVPSAHPTPAPPDSISAFCGAAAVIGYLTERGPQSVQSEPYAQVDAVASSPPSWQNLFLAYGPPGRPDECLLHWSEQSMGGGVGGDEGGGSGGEDG